MQNYKQGRYISYLLGLVSFIILLIIDQLTKFWAVSKLKPLGTEGVPIIKNVFELLYLENRGAAFGLMQNKHWLFVILTIIFMILAITLYAKIPLEKKFFPLHGILIIICSGAVGNLIDRIQYNYVVDFLYFKLIDFPIFNVADIYVVCGAALLFILFIFVFKEDDFSFLNKKVGEKKNNGGN